ncbi:MAG TPA: hypothetical protein VMW80_01665 [Candidatus Dormibacteraeota bacterium]|nr:hypothetical protein [Candidatus Dormibacteraeota bacterium]
MARVPAYWLDDRRPGGYPFHHLRDSKDCAAAREAERVGSERHEGDGGHRPCSICGRQNEAEEMSEGERT